MGAGSVGTAVADAGPLIHLHEIGCVPFLRVFGALLIADSVWAEATQQDRVPPDEILSLGNVERRTVEPNAVVRITRVCGHEDLHPADYECLCLCRDTGTDLLLTDDLALRQAAQCLGLKPVGSLGVVVRAHREGLVSLADAEADLLALHAASSLFVTPAIVDLAIERLHAFEQKPQP